MIGNFRKLIAIPFAWLSFYSMSAQEKKDSVKTQEIQTVTLNKKVIQQVGDKTYFNVENSPVAKGNNGLEVLQKSPKLSVNSDGKILLHNKPVTVLINGRKAQLEDADLKSYMENLTSENIKRIEIQEVSGSDQDASNEGGVINIITKKIPTGFRAIAKTGYTFRKEGFDQYKSGLNLNAGGESWNIYSDINYSDNQNRGKARSVFNYNNGNQTITSGENQIHNTNFGSRLGAVFYPNDKNEMGVEGYFNRFSNDYTSQANLNILQNGQIATTSQNNSITIRPVKLWYVTGNYLYKFGKNGNSLKFIGDFGKNVNNPFNEVVSVYPQNAALDNHYTFVTNSVSKYYTAQLDLVEKFENKFEVDAGVKYGNVSRNNLLDVNYLQNGIWQNATEQNQDFENRESILAGYVSASKDFGKHFLKLGLRVENTDIQGLNRINNNELSQNYTEFFPSAFYKYNFSSDKTFSASYNRSITRAPFQYLNPYVTKENDYLYQIGNPDLQPAFYDKINLRFDYKNHSVSFLAGFTKNTFQGIYFTKYGINYWQVQNFGDNKRFALDYSYSKSIMKWLYTKLDAGVFYNTFVSADGLNFGKSSFYISSFNQFKLPKNWTMEVSNNFNYRQMYNQILIKNIYEMDIAVKKSFVDNQILMTFGIDDVFNTSKSNSISFYKDFNFEFYQKNFTRQIFLNIQYTLDNKIKMKSSSVRSENETRQRL